MAVRRARVLVIDDDPYMGKLLARILEPEYEIVVATSALEALDYVAMGDKFELVLCDVMMPQMTGMAFYERIGAVAPELLKKVVFMTGGAFTPSAEAFLQQGFIQIIEKPFPPLPELRAVIRKHIGRLGRYS